MQIKDDKTENGDMIGALQSQNYGLSQKINGSDCSSFVEGIDATMVKVHKSDGEILRNKLSSPTLVVLLNN